MARCPAFAWRLLVVVARHWLHPLQQLWERTVWRRVQGAADESEDAIWKLQTLVAAVWLLGVALILLVAQWPRIVRGNWQLANWPLIDDWRSWRRYRALSCLGGQLSACSELPIRQHRSAGRWLLRGRFGEVSLLQARHPTWPPRQGQAAAITGAKIANSSISGQLASCQLPRTMRGHCATSKSARLQAAKQRRRASAASRLRLRIHPRRPALAARRCAPTIAVRGATNAALTTTSSRQATPGHRAIAGFG